MRASARIHVDRRDGRDALVDVRSEPPLAVRAAGDRVLLVGSAAAPVGGDDLRLDVTVGAGARLTLGTVAATMAWPSPRGETSSQRVHARVGASAHLAWVPEPLVLVAGCRHRVDTTIDVAPGSTAWIVDEVALGRTDEASGSVQMSWRVERDGLALVHHAEHLGADAAGWGSAVTMAGHRHLLTALGIGVPQPEAAPLVATDAAIAVLPIAADVWVALATGVDRVAVHRVLPAGWPDASGQVGGEPRSGRNSSAVGSSSRRCSERAGSSTWGR